MIKNPVYEVSILPENGGIIGSFKIDGKEIIHFRSEERGSGFFRDLFWQPTEARWTGEEDANYEFKGWEFENKNLVLKFERKLKFEKLKGLVIKKNYVLNHESYEIKVEYTIENLTENKLSFSFWCHSQPVLSSKDAEISIPLLDKNLVLNKDTAKEYDYFIPVKDVFSNEIEYSLSKLVNGKLKFVFEKEKTDKVYIWFGKIPTVEFIYNEVELNPKKSWQTEVNIKVF
ncbi:MAG: YidC/Oxa1 family insertase periplasmic-domain containing protein [Candidatus Ratteibacteria bacterium]